MCIFSGTHRPLWPRYGEYKFVPRQRWVHNLEVNNCIAHLEMSCFVYLQLDLKYGLSVLGFDIMSNGKPKLTFQWDLLLPSSGSRKFKKNIFCLFWTT